MTFEELQAKLPESERKAIAYEVIAELYPNIEKENYHDTSK